MLGGILLTGGASRRMGRDKATLELDGVGLAVRVARLLEPLVDLAVEVGGGVTELSSVREHPPLAGPLAAVLAGRAALEGRGLEQRAACLVLACDLPRLSETVISRLATWPGEESILPVIGGEPQPLCARWSGPDFALAGAAFASGDRSLRHVPDRLSATLLDESIWGDQREAFDDVDTPADLVRLGLAPAAASGGAPPTAEQPPREIASGGRDGP